MSAFFKELMQTIARRRATRTHSFGGCFGEGLEAIARNHGELCLRSGTAREQSRSFFDRPRDRGVVHGQKFDAGSSLN